MFKIFTQNYCCETIEPLRLNAVNGRLRSYACNPLQPHGDTTIPLSLRDSIALLSNMNITFPLQDDLDCFAERLMALVNRKNSFLKSGCTSTVEEAKSSRRVLKT